MRSSCTRFREATTTGMRSSRGQASQGEYEMKEPSLYTSLKRLESQGFVESYWGSETQGARRKYYRITSDGVQELGEATERWIQVRKIIDRLLNQEGSAQ